MADIGSLAVSSMASPACWFQEPVALVAISLLRAYVQFMSLKAFPAVSACFRNDDLTF